MATARAKLTSTQDYQLLTCFEEIRKTLMDERYEDRRSKPLAYWTLPTDRRLPLVFLRRSLGDLLQTPFEELVATPGVGRKKIRSLVQLMYRAAAEELPPVPFGLMDWTTRSENAAQPDPCGAMATVDPGLVSEQLWSRWCRAVRHFEVGDLPLGRAAPSLAELPTVIWLTPLQRYAHSTLEEIRNFRTHGEKRVRCIVEVFHSVHERIHDAQNPADARQRLIPGVTRQVQSWIEEVIERREVPTADEVRERFTGPLLRQLRVDCGPTVHRLACERLGFDRPARSVRAMARQMSVTRARVYQLLDDCAKVLAIRWPEGQATVERLVQFWLGQSNIDQAAWDAFYRTYQLCFAKGLRVVSEGDE